jgi:demethylsterigmatocystin 6-O-methyltransferase
MKYESVTNNTKTPAQQAWNTELPFFVWLSNQSQRFGNLQKFMTIQRAGTVSWLSAFPFKEKLGNFQGKTAFVDIGGGFGHQCIALKKAFPELTGKLILEDQS